MFSFLCFFPSLPSISHRCFIHSFSPWSPNIYVVNSSESLKSTFTAMHKICGFKQETQTKTHLPKKKKWDRRLRTHAYKIRVYDSVALRTSAQCFKSEKLHFPRQLYLWRRVKTATRKTTRNKFFPSEFLWRCTEYRVDFIFCFCSCCERRTTNVENAMWKSRENVLCVSTLRIHEVETGWSGCAYSNHKSQI